MVVAAISTAAAILAWIGLALGVVVAAVVLALLESLRRPLFEIRRYAAHVRDGIDGIARNTEGLDGIARTRALALAVPELAVAYLRRLGLVR